MNLRNLWFYLCSPNRLIEIPDDLYTSLEKHARDLGVNPLQLVRMFFKFGFLITVAHNDPDTQIIIRKQGYEDRVIEFDL